MIVCRNVLLSGQTTAQAQATGANPAPFYFPEHRAWWCIDTIYTIVVEAVIGAPTTASLSARFQVAQPTTAGQMSGTNYVDTAYVWADAPSNNGDWPAVIADQTAVNVVKTFRIAGGISHRLVLDPTFTGGTNPAFRLTVESKMRGY